MKLVVEQEFSTNSHSTTRRLKHYGTSNLESVENVQSSNVVEFEFELRHIPSTNALPLCQTTTTTYLLTVLYSTNMVNVAVAIHQCARSH